MRLTKTKLKQIIREELRKVIREQHGKISDQAGWLGWAKQIRQEFPEDWSSNDLWPTPDANDQLVIYFPHQFGVEQPQIESQAMAQGAESVEYSGQDMMVINTGLPFEGSTYEEPPVPEFEKQQTQRNLDRDAIRMQREY